MLPARGEPTALAEDEKCIQLEIVLRADESPLCHEKARTGLSGSANTILAHVSSCWLMRCAIEGATGLRRRMVCMPAPSEVPGMSWRAGMAVTEAPQVTRPDFVTAGTPGRYFTMIALTSPDGEPLAACTTPGVAPTRTAAMRTAHVRPRCRRTP